MPTLSTMLLAGVLLGVTLAITVHLWKGRKKSCDGNCGGCGKCH